MIYFMPICEPEQMEKQYQYWLPHLPTVRQEKLLRYRFVKDRWLCAAAYMLLRHGLQEEYDIYEDEIVMKIADSGKPYLANHPHIYFSFSHCDAGVACGIGNMPIGIDVEMIRTIDPEVTKRVFTTTEQEIIAQSEKPSLTFIAMWTLKESWIKAIGCGLSHSLRKISVKLSLDRVLYINQDGYKAFVIDQQDSYCISACWKTPKNAHISSRGAKSDKIIIKGSIDYEKGRTFQ